MGEDATNDANITATRIARGDNVRVAGLRERKPISLMQLIGFKVGVVVQTLVKWFVLVRGTWYQSKIGKAIIFTKLTSRRDH